MSYKKDTKLRGSLFDCGDILFVVSHCFDLRPDQLRGRGRTRDVVEARSVAMFAMREQLGMSSVEVGRYFERDHGTVLHACKNVRSWLKYDREFQKRWPKVAAAVLQLWKKSSIKEAA